MYLKFVTALLSHGVISVSRAKALADLPAPRPMTLLIDDGARFSYFTPGSEDELHSAARLAFRNWEPRSRDLFSQLAAQSSLILDIGAYSGVYGLMAAASNPNANVVMFEPNPKMAAQIRENLLINDLRARVALHQLALSNFEGTTSLFLSTETHTAGIASIEYEPGSHPINSGVPRTFTPYRLQVSVQTLDSFALTSIDLVKVDAEGSEARIFAGAAQTLKRDLPIIFSEALTARALDDQHNQLAKFGYLPPLPVARFGSYGDDCNFIWVSERDLPLLRSLIDVLD